MKLKFIILALAILFSQTACTLFLLGGEGADGYYVDTDSHSVGQTADDAAITSSVIAKNIQD